MWRWDRRAAPLAVVEMLLMAAVASGGDDSHQDRNEALRLTFPAPGVRVFIESPPHIPPEPWREVWVVHGKGRKRIAVPSDFRGLVRIDSRDKALEFCRFFTRWDLPVFTFAFAGGVLELRRGTHEMAQIMERSERADKEGIPSGERWKLLEKEGFGFQFGDVGPETYARYDLKPVEVGRGPKFFIVHRDLLSWPAVDGLSTVYRSAEFVAEDGLYVHAALKTLATVRPKELTLLPTYQ